MFRQSISCFRIIVQINENIPLRSNINIIFSMLAQSWKVDFCRFSYLFGKEMIGKK